MTVCRRCQKDVPFATCYGRIWNGSTVVLTIMSRYVKGGGTENERALDGKTRFSSAYNAFNIPAGRSAANGCRPAFSESLCRPAARVNRNVFMRTTIILLNGRLGSFFAKLRYEGATALSTSLYCCLYGRGTSDPATFL